MAIETRKRTRELLKAGVLVTDETGRADVDRAKGDPNAARAMRAHTYHDGRRGPVGWVLCYPWLLAGFFSVPAKRAKGVQ